MSPTRRRNSSDLFRSWKVGLGVALMAITAGIPTLKAQVAVTWGATVNGTWNTGANWVGGSVPANSLTTNYALFSNATGVTVTPNVSPLSIAGLEFGANAGAYTLSQSGTNTTFNIGGYGIQNYSANDQVITGTKLTLTLGAAAAFNVQGAGDLTISATGGNLATTATNTLTLGGTGTGVGTITSAITGTGTVTKNDAGTWILSGANTFSGALTINSGTLRGTVAGALGSGGVVLSGGTLSLGNNSGTSFGDAVSLTTNGTIISDRGTTSGAGVAHTLGALSMGAQTLFVSAGSLVTSGTAGVTMGATTLSGNATFDVGANAQLTLGALTEGGLARTITKTDTGTLIFGSNASSTTAGSQLVVNAGIAQANTSTALGAGAFSVNVNATDAANPTAAFNVNGTANQAIGTLTFGGSGAVAGATNSVGGSGTLTLGGDVTYDATNNPGAATISSKVALGANRVFNVGDSTGTSAELTVSGIVSGTLFGIEKDGAGTLVLSGASTNTGTTLLSAGTLRATTSTGALGAGSLTLAAGTLELSNDTGLAFGRNTTVSGATTIVSDRLTAGAGVTHSLGTLLLNVPSLTVNAGSNVTSGTAGVTFGATTLTANDATFIVGANTNLTLGALGGAFSVVKDGPGMMTLNAASTRTTTAGSTTLLEGTLQLAHANALNTNAAAGLTLNGGTLLLGLSTATTFTGTAITMGADATVASGRAAAGAGVTHTVGALSIGAQRLSVVADSTVTSGTAGVTFGATTLTGGATFDVGTAAQATLGAVGQTGTQSLTKEGAGTLVFNGTNTYSGLTTLNAGTLTVNAGATIFATTGSLLVNAGTLNLNNTGQQTIGSLNGSAGTINLASGVVLAVTTSGTDTFSGTLAGAGSFGMGGTGTFNLTGTNTLSGTVYAAGGTLNLGSNGALGTATLNLYSNDTVAAINGARSFSNAVTLTGSSTIAGSNDLTFTGTLTNTAANTLTVNNTAATQFGAIALSNSATARTLTFAGTGNATVTGIIANGGTSTLSGLTYAGSGILTLTNAASTYTGVTTVNSGTLSVGTLANGGLASSIGQSTNVAGNLVLNGGTLRYTGAAVSTNRLFSVGAAGGAIEAAGSGTLTFSNTGSIGFNSQTGARTLTLLGSGNGALASVIGDNTGATALAKSGSGTWTLSGTNTYTGTTSVSQGTLIASGASSLGGTTAAAAVTSGGTLSIAGGTTITKSATLSLAGTGATATTGALHAGGTAGQTSEWRGNLALTSDATATAANNLLIIGNGSTFANTLSLGANTLTLSTPSAAVVTPSYLPAPTYTLDATNIMVNSAITGTGGLIKTGTGTATLIAGAAGGNTFTGNTVVTAGKLIVDSNVNTPGLNSAQIFVGNASSPGSADSVILQMGQLASPPASNNMIGTWNSVTNASSSNLTIYSDGVFKMNRASNGFANLTLEGGHVDGGSILSNPLLTLTGSVTTNASSRTAVIDNGNVAMSANNFTFAIASGTAPGGVDLRIDSILQNGVGYTAGSAGTSLNKTGAGTLALTNLNTYSGVTNVAGGILNIRHASALGQTGSSYGDTANGTVVQSGAQLQLQGGITVGAFESLTLNGSGISTDGALRNLSGNNTYNGFVYLGSDSRINADTGTTLTIANTNGVNATIMNGTAAGRNLTVGGLGDTVVNGGIASSVNSITKEDSGMLTLAGTNSYAGATNVNAGTVRVTNSYGLSGTGVNVAAGATLQFARDAGNNNISVVGVGATINGTGMSGGGAIQNFSGANSYLGLVTLGSASLITANSATSLTLSGGIATAGQALTIGSTANNGNVTVSGNMTGSGSVTKDGSGTLTFSGTTGTVGATHLNAGTVSVATGSTLNTGAFDSAVSTTLLIASGGSVVANYASGSTTFAGAMSGSGGFTKTGAGTLVFDHTFTASNLTLTLSGGTLSLTGGQFTFGTIHITGNTVLDFNNSAGTFLSSGSLVIDAGVTVTVNNWTSIANNAALSTVWYASNTVNGNTLGATSQVGGTPLSQVVFTNYTGLTTTWVSGNVGGWFDHEIRPTPEPATYGAILISGCLGLLGFRRFRRKRAARA